MKYLLLGTSGCHLCEEAETIINSCLPTTILEIELIDIAEHTEWQADFAVRIPVLINEQTKQTLNWPFSKSQVIHFFNITTP